MKTYRTRLLVCGVIGAAAAVVTATGALVPELEVEWFTVDAGGTMFSTGGNLELSGTIGQPDAGGPLIGGGFELTGGFWIGQAPGDCNWDGGVNLIDFSDFEACLAGPDAEPGGTPCPCFDRDGDGDVDLADFARFQQAFTGQ